MLCALIQPSVAQHVPCSLFVPLRIDSHVSAARQFKAKMLHWLKGAILSHGQVSIFPRQLLYAARSSHYWGSLARGSWGFGLCLFRLRHGLELQGVPLQGAAPAEAFHIQPCTKHIRCGIVPSGHEESAAQPIRSFSPPQQLLKFSGILKVCGPAPPFKQEGNLFLQWVYLPDHAKDQRPKPLPKPPPFW